MKTKLISILIALMAGAGMLSADIIEHVQIGDFYYNLDAENLTANRAVTATDTLSSGTMYLHSSTDRRTDHIQDSRIRTSIPEWVLRDWRAFSRVWIRSLT